MEIPDNDNRTDAERFGIDESLLNPCICGKVPRTGSVTHGHGDFGPKVYCECGHTVVQDYFRDTSMEEKWNRYNPR